MGAVPLTAQHAVGRLPGLKEPALVSSPDATLWLIWLEQRPQERGRTTALIRRFGDSEATPQELTPAPSNLRSRVHDYGGGVLATAVEQDRLLLAWIDRGCLWTGTGSRHLCWHRRWHRGARSPPVAADATVADGRRLERRERHGI